VEIRSFPKLIEGSEDRKKMGQSCVDARRMNGLPAGKAANTIGTIEREHGNLKLDHIPAYASHFSARKRGILPPVHKNTGFPYVSC